MLFRRLAIASSLVVSALAAFTVVAVAAGGGFGPGTYSFKSHSANAFFGSFQKGGPPSPAWSVSVNQGLNSFKPEGGQRIVNDDTVVSLFEFDTLGHGGFGCFVVPDGDFTVSRDLDSASLHTTLTAGEACPGSPTPVGGKGQAGGGGGNGGLVLPITLDVTWSSAGPVTTYQNSFSVSCLDYSIDGKSTNDSVTAQASGANSALSGSFTSAFSSVDSTRGSLDIKGVPQSGCFAY